MAAGINDKFKKVSADNSYAVATTVKTARTVGGGTTLEAFDLSKWADATAVNFLTYRKTTDPVTNITTVTNRTGWTALANTGSNTLTNLTIAPGYTDLGHQVGDYIEPVQMSKWANDLVDGILVTHNQDGTLKNKVATLAKINGGSTDGVLLTDASGNVTGGKVTADKLDFATLNFGNYSTTEKDTGFKWHNGKTIYKITSIFDRGTGTTYSHTLPTGVEDVVSVDAIARASTSAGANFIPFPYTGGAVASSTSYYRNSATTMRFDVGTDFASTYHYVVATILYTKS